MDKTDTDIGERIDKLDGKIFPITYKLPLTNAIEKGNDNLNA